MTLLLLELGHSVMVVTGPYSSRLASTMSRCLRYLIISHRILKTLRRKIHKFMTLCSITLSFIDLMLFQLECVKGLYFVIFDAMKHRIKLILSLVNNYDSLGRKKQHVN